MKVISVVGHKNSGKTALVSRLVTALSGIGSVGTVKHMAPHRFNPEDTDTGKHFDAGADVVVGVTKDELVTIARDPSLDRALDALADGGMDFAVVEGYKESDLPKIILGDMEDVPDLLNVVATLPERSDWNIDELVVLTRAQPDRVTLKLLIKKVQKNPAIRKAGAIGTFTGIVREYTYGLQTQVLEFEKYEEMADASIERICTELKQKDGIIDVVIHHKTGRVEPGEDIVYIVVASSHRTQLFPVLSEAIERVKHEVPIWKKEITVDGEFWVHDHA
ncbi:MAG TPA: molybdopterin synthase [Methanosarcinaceae archaeon]|nr:molybdopterin synthase [Methanosarcinaceae archaeon]